ncbi:MAG: thiol:disulfide interchange protein DsbA/DsbL [Steroidobacteraceae bacterium]
MLAPPQHTSVAAGQVEVMEVFSYGCIVCNRFQPLVEKLKHSLPPNAQFVLLPASFIASEDWPMFQRAYLAAKTLGISERTHQLMYDAIWKTGELAISDPVTHRLRSSMPTIEDAARFYEREAGIQAGTFLDMANSFSVDLKMKVTDAQVVAMQVASTPTFIVNGKYRVILDSLTAQGEPFADQLIELINYLVGKESAR